VKEQASQGKGKGNTKSAEEEKILLRETGNLGGGRGVKS